MDLRTQDFVAGNASVKRRVVERTAELETAVLRHRSRWIYGHRILWPEIHL